MDYDGAPLAALQRRHVPDRRPCARTGVLARSLPGCSKKMLTQTLREMERDRLIDRKVYPVVPPMVEYSLTPIGRLFIEPIEMLYAWAAKNDDALSKLRRRRKKQTASVTAQKLARRKPGESRSAARSQQK